MLAAVPTNEDRALAMVQLVLRLSKDQQEIPVSLRAYFDNVIEQALILASDPKSINGSILPEAIHLALKIRQKQELGSAMQDIQDSHIVSSEVASIILKRLEFEVAT